MLEADFATYFRKLLHFSDLSFLTCKPKAMMMMMTMVVVVVVMMMSAWQWPLINVERSHCCLPMVMELAGKASGSVPILP